MRASLSPEVRAFYEEGRLRFRTTHAIRGVVFGKDVDTSTREEPIDSFEPDSEIGRALGENVRRLYDSIEVHEVEVDGQVYQIEIGVLYGSGEAVRLHNATYSSSLTTNYGNGFEVARDALLDPETTQVYVGAPGIGMTSPLTPAEQKYLRRWGRLLDSDDLDDIRALPFVHALGRALNNMDLRVTHLHSDSAGALPSLAYGTVFGGGNIQSSHQNVRPGIRSMGAVSLAYGMLHSEGVRSRAHAAITPDVLGMSDAKVAFVRQHIDHERWDRVSPSKRMLVSNLVGLGRGPGYDDGDPLVADNIAFAHTNPEAGILCTVGSMDPSAKHRKLYGRMECVARRVSVHSRKPADVVVFEGMSHSIQTHYPQYLQAVARFILNL